MKSVKVQFYKMERVTIVVMLLILFLQSCTPQAKGKKSTLKSASTDASTNKIPEFTSGTNFIQNGADVFLSTVKLGIGFTDSIQLRGKDVDGYIRASGTSSVVCLTSRFETTNRIILLAAIARSIYNFTTQTTEYYYNIAPSDSMVNQTFCQKTGLINQLNSYYSLFTPKFNIQDICPLAGTCNVTNFSGKSLELYNQSGVAITQIATRQLQFLINNTPTTENPAGVTCTETSQCTTQGYDCCSSGQCVRDLAQKPGIDSTSSAYLQSVQDILNNPAAIYSYPQYYFICSDPVNFPTKPEANTDPLNEATARIKRLENLYNCTNKIEGEYGVCTATFENVQPNDGIKYSAGADDRNFSKTFSNILVSENTLVSIEKIIYGGVVLYDYSTKDAGSLFREPYEDIVTLPQVAPFRITGGHNDDVQSGAYVEIFKKPDSAISNTLEIKYKVDASCTLVNSSLAKCEKYYIQGQQNSGDTPASYLQGRVTDHYPGNGLFKLPTYANLSKAIRVEVDGLLQKLDFDWELNIGATGSIQFIPANSPKVTDGQKVRIIYFVDINPDENVASVMSSKRKALKEIKTICSCPDLSCNLTPVKNASKKIIDYACVYPDPVPVEPPVSQKVFVSSKSVPVRFFDNKGSSQNSIIAGMVQEGQPFSYTGGDLLKPSNLTDYVGFNEIYGSISYAGGSAKPAYQVNVKKGNTYDIYVDRGALSNCIQCGNDYFSQLNKLFPLTQFGGGVKPLLGQTNRTMTAGIRSDELKFGRACVVPATMIPWSHGSESTEITQRANRMRAQHFLYANGYQYDWYGFDYGSVIGSFDGVKWFSIGTNRRIKAESSKMFVAINAAMGDLSLESTYEVTVNDSLLNPLGTNLVTSDYNSDGAECQQFHQCATDNDCASTLGWEYACAPVSELSTSWPKFDDNGKEIPEIVETKSLTSILGISSPGKRCVYRGRGALCTQNYASASINIETNFNKSNNQTLHACSDNNYCQSISTNGTGAQAFNNRIVRYGKVRVDTTVDSFGLAALIPGRPFAWNAAELPRAETLKNLNTNRVFSMCLPGRDVEMTSFLDQNKTTPSTTDYKGDKVLGIGMTHSTSAIPVVNYLNACSIMDSTYNFYHNIASSPSATMNSTNYPMLQYDAGSQAVSTNALSIFNTIFNTKGISFGLLKTNTAILNSVAFTENRCMRAPAASCFSDLDCSPSKVISDKLKSISADDTVVNSILNKYEIKFWQEELICSQAIAKSSASYDPKNNYCCRDVGNTISLPSADITNNLDYKKVAGIDYTMNEPLRYTRAATMYKSVNTDPINFPELRTAIVDQCNTASGCQSIAGLNNQFRTFSAFAEKTSCSGDWVRPFSTGTHKWEVGRFQTFSPNTFQCMNWYPGTGGYTCADYEADDPNCPIVQTSPLKDKAKEVLNYLAKLELTGIPQIYLEPESYFSGTEETGLSCKSLPGNRAGVYPIGGTNYTPPTQLFAALAKNEYTDGSSEYLSALDAKNFKTMKQVFKADEVVSCLAAGTQMKQGDDPAKCCTGMINSSNLKCQLPDYVDVSVYTNRYVSSEAKKLSTTLFDQNGYIKDPAYAAKLACEKSMCASGKLAFGVLISLLPVPGQTESDSKYYRFLEGNAEDSKSGLLSLYNKGLKLNNHVYCIPEALAQSSSGSSDVFVIPCGN